MESALSERDSKRRVAELFAGVGGFRLGLEGHPDHDLPGSGWEVVWSNQWEPSTNKQHASECYERNWPGDGPAHSNDDISAVLDQVERGEYEIPAHDLLVGGFPCQDYSVAKTLSHATGLRGKKGVLWWQIERLIRLQRERGEQPRFLILENVDRLLKSPAGQRGRDFAVVLASLNDLGYLVEWRVVNAADYGLPQKRRRVFIIGYLIEDAASPWGTGFDWMLRRGALARALPVEDGGAAAADDPTFHIPSGDLASVSDEFGLGAKTSAFRKAGVAWDRAVWTCDPKPLKEAPYPLKKVLVPPEDVPGSFWVDSATEIARWQYLKGAKDEPRTSKSGFEYHYKEGAIPFPDDTDQPSRTILTSEGGRTPSRSKHIILQPGTDRLRRLTPEELEALNGFPPGWTRGMPEGRRAFMMGNALVVDVVQRIGEQLDLVAREFERE